MNHQPLSREVAREAAQWLSLLHSGEASHQDQQACRQWRQAKPEHEQAWSRAQAVQQKLGLIPPPLGMETLNRQQRYNRRQTLKTLAVLIAAGPVAYGTYRSTPWQSLSADYRTAVGEQRHITLTDGTELHLNTATSVDVQFSAQQRLLILHRGEVLIETGKDPQQRPLLVTTSQGKLRPIGTRFMVQTIDENTRLSVLQGAVEIQPLNAQAHTLSAGEQTEFGQQSIEPIHPLAQQAGSWSQGVFYANNLPLSEFVKELSRYRNGALRCDSAVANLRISGVFQLNNTDRILASLPDTLPVEVNSLLGMWVTVKAK